MEIPITIDENYEFDRASHGDRLVQRAPLTLFVDATPRSLISESIGPDKYNSKARSIHNSCLVSELIERALAKLALQQRDEYSTNNISMPIFGDVMVGKDVIYSPSRKTHPFLSLPVPQLSLALILVTSDNSCERILEDFECIDVTRIGEYERPHNATKFLDESVMRHSIGPESFGTKHHLILRQSPNKYDIFYKQHDISSEANSFDYNSMNFEIKLEDELVYTTIDAFQSNHPKCNKNRPNHNTNTISHSTSSMILYKGEFALLSDALKNGEITIKNSSTIETNLEVNSPYCDEKHIEENENQIELELFGPKPKFVDDNCKAEMKNAFMTNNSMHDNTQSNKAGETKMTSSNVQLFTSLADHDIFYRWHRVHSNVRNDIMTNHMRKTRSVDKKAPTRINIDSDKSKSIVRHLIILNPNSRNDCDKEESLDGITMKENRSSAAKSSTNCIKVLCFDNSTQFNNWLAGIRLAKFRESLKTSFQKLNSQKQEYDANLASNKIQHLSISQLSTTPSSSAPMSKSMTVISKNPHLNSYNPPKTTPIQITNHANLQNTSGFHNISRNTSKFQQLKQNIWPSSLPSSALPTSPNSQQHEIPASTSSSNHFLSTLFSSIRNGNCQSSHKQDKKSTTCYSWRDRVDSSSSRAMLVTSTSTPNNHLLLPGNRHTNRRRASIPVNTTEDITVGHSSIELPNVSGSTSTMSNKSSLSSTSTCLKDESLSDHFALHSLNQGFKDSKEKNLRAIESPAFHLEEAIKEDIGSPSDVPNEIEEAVMVAFDRSGEGGELRIVTDPNEIRNIEIEEQERKRNTSRLQMALIQQPWFTIATNFAVNEMIFKAGRVDGCFLVRSSNYRSSQDPTLDTFALSMMYQDNIMSYRILQKRVFSRTVFTLDSGETRFASIPSLVEFYQLNKGILPCVLTYYPLL